MGNQTSALSYSSTSTTTLTFTATAPAGATIVFYPPAAATTTGPSVSTPELQSPYPTLPLLVLTHWVAVIVDYAGHTEELVTLTGWPADSSTDGSTGQTSSPSPLPAPPPSVAIATSLAASAVVLTTTIDAMESSAITMFEILPTSVPGAAATATGSAAAAVPSVAPADSGWNSWDTSDRAVLVVLLVVGVLLLGLLSATLVVCARRWHRLEVGWRERVAGRRRHRELQEAEERAWCDKICVEGSLTEAEFGAATERAAANYVPPERAESIRSVDCPDS